MLYANGYPVGGSGGGGGTGGHTIIDENGNSMTARAGLQFVGGANIEDDGTNNKTIVDLASASGIDGVFIDTDNVITSDTINSGSVSHTYFEYTATEDCAILLTLYYDGNDNSNKEIEITINNSRVARFGGNSTVKSEWDNTFLLKKGQTIKANYLCRYASYRVCGIQTGTTHSKFQPVFYSTEEREVGVWVDGKPLYEKTWDFGSDLVCNSNSWTDTPITKGDIEKIVDIKAVNNAGTIWDMLGANTDQTYVQVYHNRGSNNAISIRYATLQYTKTTDVAGSGTWTPQGVPTHHYSTDEQVIGTYLGETLYEKTWVFGSDLLVPYNNWISLGITLDADKIIGTKTTASSGSFQGNILVYNDNGTWKGQSPRNSDASYVKYLTLQYTKSS